MAKKRTKVKREKQSKVSNASASRRFLSYIIDWYVGALATAFPIAIISQKLYGTMLKQDILYFDAPYGLLGGILGLCCAIIYYVLIPLKDHQGQTFGKRLCKIKVVQDNGENITIKNILLRQLLGIIVIEGSLVSASAIWHQIVMILIHIDILTPLKYIGIALSIVSVLLVLFHKDHRALHDYLGKTKVIMCE